MEEQKQVFIDARKHRACKKQAKQQHRSLFGIIDHLLDLGIKSEKNLAKNVGSNIQTEKADY